MSEREPTKSGTIGLIASAMGRRRDESIEDLRDMRFGVRIDQPGDMLRDFQTAHTFDEKQSFISHRYYLADAVFVVGLEASNTLLGTIENAIRHPAFPLFLGRRSCPPVGTLVLGIREGISLETALCNESWRASAWYRKRQERDVSLEIVLDAEINDKGAFTRNDTPLSFDQKYRRYGSRGAVSKYAEVQIRNPEGRFVHDAMRGL